MGKILIVDDEAGLRSFLKQALALAGHEVTTASSAEEGIDLLQQTEFEVVLTDLHMPGAGGMHLVEHLSQHQPTVEIIVLTAHGSVETAVKAMRLGAADFLQKPLKSPKHLRTVVDAALDRHRVAPTAAPIVHEGLFLEDPAMRPVERGLQRVALTRATVLLQGESGTGKEVAARRLHAWSPRAAAPFVAINCAVLTESLLESELFGHEKGAFTGAESRRIGKIERAEGGTVFLDEIGELAPALQAKLLRLLQERTFERLGGHEPITVDVRWVAATNRKLEEQVQEGAFREDLYHRLAVFPVQLPALRDRPLDILPLTQILLRDIAEELGQPVRQVDEVGAAILQQRRWPGNIRELRNVLSRACILTDGPTLSPEDLRGASVGSSGGTSGAPTLAEAERSAIEAALRRYEGNRRLAAEHLGIGLRTLYDKLKKYGL